MSGPGADAGAGSRASGPGVGAGSRAVLLVVHALPPDEASGTPLVAHGYATALARAGWDVTVMAIEPGAPTWDRLEVVRRPGEPFSRVPV